ncbi:hypothetical protein Hanom_Chr11g01019601 [Helianthus anomalus]
MWFMNKRLDFVMGMKRVLWRHSGFCEDLRERKEDDLRERERYVIIITNDQNAPEQKDKLDMLQQLKKGFFEFWTKMTTKTKPQGPRFKKFEIWTKMAKVPKPQGPKWQFTLIFI